MVFVLYLIMLIYKPMLNNLFWCLYRDISTAKYATSEFF